MAIPISKFHKAAEQDVEDWYELGKNDFAADAGTVSLLWLTRSQKIDQTSIVTLLA